MCRLGLGMSPWSWVLVGVAAWLAPAAVGGRMLSWVLWRVAEKPAGPREPPPHRPPPQDGQPPPGGIWARAQGIRRRTSWRHRLLAGVVPAAARTGHLNAWPR